MSTEHIALEVAWSIPLIALSVFALVLPPRLTPPVRVVLSLLLGEFSGLRTPWPYRSLLGRWSQRFPFLFCHSWERSAQL